MKHICKSMPPAHLPAWSPPWISQPRARRQARAWRAWAVVATLGLAVAAGGLAGWNGLWWVIGAAWLEEAVLRSGLHEALLRRQERRPRLPSGRWVPAVPSALPWSVRARSNALVAGAFALLHLPNHPTAWALATAVPALAVGLVYQRWRLLAPCALLHGLFNLCWLLLAPTLGLPTA